MPRRRAQRATAVRGRRASRGALRQAARDEIGTRRVTQIDWGVKAGLQADRGSHLTAQHTSSWSTTSFPSRALAEARKVRRPDRSFPGSSSMCRNCALCLVLPCGGRRSWPPHTKYPINLPTCARNSDDIRRMQLSATGSCAGPRSGEGVAVASSARSLVCWTLTGSRINVVPGARCEVDACSRLSSPAAIRLHRPRSNRSGPGSLPIEQTLPQRSGASRFPIAVLIKRSGGRGRRSEGHGILT